MSMKSRSHNIRTLFAGLLLLAGLGATPAYSQNDDIAARLASFLSYRVESGVRLGVMYGVCFHADASSQECPVLQADLRIIPGRNDANNDNRRGERSRFMPFDAGVYNGFNAGSPRRRVAPGFAAAGFQATVNATTSDTWPEPDSGPDDSQFIPSMAAKQFATTKPDQEQLKADHRMTITSLAELVLVMPVPPKFSLAPSVGIGFSHIFEGEAKAPSRYAIAEQTMLAVTYAAEIDTRIGQHLDLRFQFRGIVHFPGTLTYIDAEGESFDVDVATVSVSNLLVGFGYRF